MRWTHCATFPPTPDLTLPFFLEEKPGSSRVGSYPDDKIQLPGRGGTAGGHGGHNRPPSGQRQAIIDAFTDILLTQRSSDVPCYLDSIFQKAAISQHGKQPPPDVLLADLFLFEEERMPLHTNLFNADLGNLTEKLVCKLFSMTRCDIVDDSNAAMAELESEFKALQATKSRKGQSDAKPPTWKKADFLFGSDTIVECKYRFNSYDGKLKQIRIAEAYQELGYKPVFLHISPDFIHDEQFRERGLGSL